MSMRRMMPFTIVVLLLMQTIAMNLVVPAEAASGRGGTNDDFTVKSISCWKRIGTCRTMGAIRRNRRGLHLHESGR